MSPFEANELGTAKSTRRSRLPRVRPVVTTAIRTVAVVVAVLALLGCDVRAARQEDDPSTRLQARPRATTGTACTPGEHELRVAAGRRALMRVTPPGHSRLRAVLLALHGAGSGGSPGGLYAFRSAWNVPGLVIVAPAAAGNGWTLGQEDVRFVDRALRMAFALCPVAPRKVAVGGFSSGAGMALWLGLTNGDLFGDVIVLSGGAALPSRRLGKPRVFVAHGRRDAVIPITAGGDRIVRHLRADGYDVTYRRFSGGHRVVPEIARSAVLRVLRGP